MMNVEFGQLLLAASIVPLLFAETEEVDFEEIAAQLAAKAGVVSHVDVDYRHVTTTITLQDWEMLKVSLADLEPAPDRVEALTAVLGAMSTDATGCWDERLIVNGTTWRQWRQRRASCDSTKLYLQAQASPETQVQNPPQQIDIRVGDGEYLAVYDAFKLHKWTISHPVLSPLLNLDISLAPWHDAINNPPNLGQTIVGAKVGDLHKIIYTTVMNDGNVFQTTYEFDASRDYLPIRVISTRNDEVMVERIFRADPQANIGERPWIILHGTRQNGNKVRVDVFGVQSWKEDVNLPQPEWRVPPFRLELNLDGDASLTLALPSFLESVEATDRLSAAMVAILANWDGDNPEVDFNVDGHIDAGDIEYVIQFVVP